MTSGSGRGDAGAGWLYSHALWTFRREGPSWRAGRRLRRALAANPYVPLHIVSPPAPPRRLPAAFCPGGEDEAVDYAFDALGAWEATDGAIEWLRRTVTRLLR